MNIGFDFDGVLADTAGMAITQLNKEFGSDFTTNIFNNYYFDDNIYFEDENKQKNAVDFLMNSIYDIDDFKLIKPYSHADLVLNKIKYSGCKIFIITKRPFHEATRVIDWMADKQMPFDSVVCTGIYSKADYALEYGLDFYIDDLGDNITDIEEELPADLCKYFLIDRPWNSKYKHQFNTIRNLKEFLTEIEKGLQNES